MSEDPKPESVREAVCSRSPSLSALLRVHYDSVVDIAERIRARESHRAAPSPVSLVHEAFVRLVDQPKVSAGDSLFFRACFAQECRRVLVDSARRRNAQRRGGGAAAESVADQTGLGVRGELDLVEVDDAIETLAKLDERAARIVTMRVFGGLTVAECAESLGVSPRTVDDDWAFARAWLQKKLR
jgi:RNA polymerase sigma-70 factor (ECF subfamily)